MRLRLFFAIPLILACAATATSHHSFAAVYDETRLVTISGGRHGVQICESARDHVHGCHRRVW